MQTHRSFEMTDDRAKGDAFDRRVDDFGRQRQELLEQLAIELRQADPSGPATEFGRVMRHAQKVLGKSELELSRLFKVSRPTVNRWMRGVTAPLPLLRQAVYDTMIVEVRTAMKGLRATA